MQDRSQLTLYRAFLFSVLYQSLERSEHELAELRRGNNELQLQRRKMAVQLAEAQAQLERVAAPEVRDDGGWVCLGFRQLECVFEDEDRGRQCNECN